MNIRESNCLLAGRLASLDEMEPGRRPAFINNNGAVQFAISVTSDVPEHLANTEIYTCWDNKLVQYGYVDNSALPEPERIHRLEEFLKQKIILFRPLLRMDNFRNERYETAEPKALLSASPQVANAERLVPILYVKASNQEFEEKIRSQRPIAPGQAFLPGMPLPDPISVLVVNEAGYFMYGYFERMLFDRNKWVVTGKDFKKIHLEPGFVEQFILPHEDVALIEANAYFGFLYDEMENEWEPIAQINPRVLSPDSDLVPPSEDEGQSLQVEVASATDEALDSLRNESNHRLPTAALAQNHKPVTAPSIQQDVVSEEMFIHHLCQLAQVKGLLYDQEDLIGFHTAAKAGGLVLLSGMSGTGKSRLADLYGEALGLCASQHLVLPVQPTWTDDSDVLGFLDLSTNIYRPADTGLVDLLLAAERDPEQLFMAVFDEMNLARVEHYFSQFLSTLEAEEGKRQIRLYHERLADRVYNSSAYPPTISIGRNVLFVGTVNVDESTYAFSDKVLDRARVIRPKILPFNLLQSQLQEDILPIERVTITHSMYNRWRRTSRALQLTEREIDFLYKLHSCLHQVDLQMGIGYRTLRQISDYVYNIPLSSAGQPMIDRGRVFDAQLVQKVFPKLRGPQEQLGELIGRFVRKGEVEDSVLMSLMDDYQDVSDFAQSRLEVENKAKELKYYGYTS